MKVEEFKTVVQTVFKTLEDVGYYQNYPPTDIEISHFMSFMKSINEQYPLDSVDLMDMVNACIRHYTVPRPAAVKMIERSIIDADFKRSDISWSYRHPVLTAYCYSRDSDCKYEIIFTSFSGGMALSLPIAVTILIRSVTDNDDESIIRSESYVFRNRDEWLIDFPSWLYAVHYGIPFIGKYDRHKFGLYKNENQLTADCSCGKWTCGSTNKDHDEQYMKEKWFLHVNSHPQIND